MADTPLVSFLNNIQVQGVQSVSAIRAAVNIPPTIITLPIGTLLSGFIVGKDTRGNAVLKTDKGEISLKTPLALEMNSEIVLRVEGSGEQFKARIVSVNGRPPEHVTPLPATIEPAAGSPTGKIPLTPATPLLIEEPALIVSTPEKTASLLKAVFLNPSPMLKEITKTAAPLPADIIITPARITPGATLIIRMVENDAAPALPTQQTNQPSFAPPPAAAPANVAPSTSTVPTPVITQPAAPLASSALPSTPAGILQAPSPPSPATPTLPPGTLLSQPAAASLSPIPLPNTNAPVTAALAPPATKPTATIANTQPQVVTTIPPRQTSLPTAMMENQSASVAAQKIPATSAQLTSPLPIPPSPAIPNTNIPNPVFISPLLPDPAMDTSMEGIFRVLHERVLYGRVVGMEKSNETVIHTPLGTLKIQTEIPLPKDSRLKFEIVEVRPSSNNPAPAPVGKETAAGSIPPALPGTATTSNILSTGMTSLFALTAFAAHTDNPIIKEAINRAIPQIGPRLGASLLFFISALRGGDVANWLGPQTVALMEQAGQKELLNRLANEFTALRTIFNDVPTLPAPAQPWQLLMFPVIAGHDLHHVKMYVKKDREEKNKVAATDAPTRFIVEVNLPALGEMQMDGFVKKLPTQTRFDLMIRTHQALPAAIQHDISQIFTGTAEITGFRGKLEFQVVKDFPIQPLNEMETSGAQSIIA